jgi:hypothetical protein
MYISYTFLSWDYPFKLQNKDRGLASVREEDIKVKVARSSRSQSRISKF